MTDRKYENLRVGFLTDTYPLMGGAGGIGTYTETVARELTEIGAEVHVFLRIGDDRFPHRQMVDGVSVWACPTWGRRREMPIRVATAFTAARFDASHLVRFSLANGVDLAAKDRPFDVLESPEFGALGGLCRVASRRRLSVRLHGPATMVQSPGSVPWTVETSPERELIRIADSVTVGSHSALSDVSSHLDIRIPNASVIANPIPWPPNDPVLPAANESLVCIGRLSVLKGYEILLRAVSHLADRRSNLEVTFVGADSETSGSGRMASENLVQLAGQLGIDDRVKIVAPLYGGELIEFVRRHSVVVLPSLVETAPIAVMEAMAWGVPLVTSALPAFKELNHDGRLFRLTNTADSVSLSLSIEDVLSHYPVAIERAKAAREYARRWAPSAIVPRLVAAWLGKADDQRLPQSN